VTASSNDIDAVYTAHAPSVFRRARILLADDDDAQHVVNDVFGLIYDQPERYLGNPALSVQLYALTTRACVNRLRGRPIGGRGGRGGEPMRRDTPDPGGAQASTAAQLDELNTRAHQLRDLLDGLEDPLAQLAVYYYLDELSQEEVSAVLGCPRRRVTSLLSQLWAAAGTSELQP
jgi:DNA-directed RNA polymerase specialized sigma24 family protein